ncbi:DUF2776 family protein [Escherichia coli]
MVWRRTCSLANRIPIITVFSRLLFCLFLASFLRKWRRPTWDILFLAGFGRFPGGTSLSIHR